MYPLLALETSQLLMFGAATIVAVMLLLRFMRAQRREIPTGRALPSFQRAERIAPSDETNSEMMRWEVQMHDTARELKAELDSKMVALQVLVRQAQEERQRLEQLLQETKQRQSS
jgi:hypothetical protein